MSIAIAVGIGALTVYLCERWLPQVLLNTSSLWALVLCLLLALGLKSLLPLPSLLIDLSDFGLIGIAQVLGRAIILAISSKDRTVQLI